MELAEVKDLFADSSTLGNPVLESDEATYKSAGAVGVWHESWGQWQNRQYPRHKWRWI